MPSPIPATVRLEEAFRRIENDRMQGMALLNPALRVEAVGFQAHGDGWLGVLITPWFINLVMLPRDASQWRELAPARATTESFPLGEFEFLVGRDETLGAYKSCTLFSPALEFTDQEAARNAALAALEVLYAQPIPAEPPAAETVSRRAFLRGEFRRQPT
jgi:[NiFe] hydrogenase assembly HybE family chaperone